MPVLTYTTRCTKKTLQTVNFVYMFQWVKPRDSTLYKGLGAVLLLPIKWPRLTGAIGTSLQVRHIPCGDQHHIKFTPYKILIHKQKLK